MLKRFGTPGIWRVYRKYIDPDGNVHARPMGRFALIADNIVVMEDYDGVIADIFPNGPFTSQDLQRMERLSKSGYWDVVLEENINDGWHPGYMKEADAGPPVGPWQAPQEEQ